MPTDKYDAVRRSADGMHRAPDNLQAAYEALQRILARDGENELLRLLVDLIEAGDILLCEERSGECITSWMAAKDSCLATRPYTIDNDVQAALAEGFLAGSFIFSVDIDPLNVRWRCRSLPVN